MFNMKEIQQHLWDVFILIDDILTRRMIKNLKIINNQVKAWSFQSKTLRQSPTDDSHETF